MVVVAQDEEEKDVFSFSLPLVDWCVVPSTSRIAAPILARPGRPLHTYEDAKKKDGFSFFFSSISLSFSKYQSKQKKHVYIAAPLIVDCHIATILNCWRGWLLRIVSELYRNQTVLLSANCLTIHHTSWPIWMNGNQFRHCEAPPPLPGARRR